MFLAMAIVKLKLFGKEITTNAASGKEEGSGIAGSPVLGVDLLPSVDADLEKEEIHRWAAVVLCPRCGSPNTKFCYFNNYNLSQPRHFCKSCQRYWTAGGALRNLHVGSGCRRKTKRSPSVTSGSAEFLQSSSTVVVVPARGNRCLSADSISLTSHREALSKASKECLNDSEPSLEPIDASTPFHFHVRPCPYGYGFAGVGGGAGRGHGTRPWKAPPWSPIAEAPLLGKHPRNRQLRLDTQEPNTQEPQEVALSSISSAFRSEEIRPDSPVSTTAHGSIFNRFPSKFKVSSVEALNDASVAMTRLISFQETN